MLNKVHLLVLQENTSPPPPPHQLSAKLCPSTLPEARINFYIESRVVALNSNWTTFGSSTHPWYGPLTVVFPLYRYKFKNFLASIQHDSCAGSLPAKYKTRVSLTTGQKRTVNTQHALGTKRRKPFIWYHARENMNLVQSEGKHALAAKKGKACTRCQSRENMCQARENMHQVTSEGNMESVSSAGIMHSGSSVGKQVSLPSARKFAPGAKRHKHSAKSRLFLTADWHKLQAECKNKVYPLLHERLK